MGPLLEEPPVRLSRDAWFKIEMALIGALVIFGLGSVLYALAGYVAAAWRWLVG